MKRYNARLKVNPPLGEMPVLQYVPPARLTIDASYQRSLDTASGQTLVRKIAQFWNWDLCQPLVVSRRECEAALFVIDGQHRLAAARLRGDIHQLPCVVVSYPDAAAEAASFVQLNQQRRPLNALEVFKAAVASGDQEAMAINATMMSVGLELAPHSNHTTWTPAMVSNIGGIQRAWREYGENAVQRGLWMICHAWPSDVKQYAGTLFPGITKVCKSLPADHRDLLCDMLAAATQTEWRGDIMKAKGNDPSLKWHRASEAVFVQAWADFMAGYLDEAA